MNDPRVMTLNLISWVISDPFSINLGTPGWLLKKGKLGPRRHRDTSEKS